MVFLSKATKMILSYPKAAIPLACLYTTVLARTCLWVILLPFLKSVIIKRAMTYGFNTNYWKNASKFQDNCLNLIPWSPPVFDGIPLVFQRKNRSQGQSVASNSLLQWTQMRRQSTHSTSSISNHYMFHIEENTTGHLLIKAMLKRATSLSSLSWEKQPVLCCN